MERHDGWSDRKPLRLLCASALLGFLLFAVVFPSWTDNVESAQAVAGTVSYPPGNPMGTYHRSALSLTVDGAALLLRLGLSEWHASVLSSGLMGAAIFSGLSSLTLAFSGSASVSLLVPVLLLSLQLSLGQAHYAWPYIGSFHGHGYPVLLANHPYVHGTTGLFSVLLAWGLLALRCDRTGAALLGILPWIHPSMALAGWIGAFAALAAGRKRYGREERLRMLRWFGGAAAVALAGMGGHRLLFPPWRTAEPELAARIVANFLDNWDVHRVLFPSLVPWMLEVDAYLAALLAALLACRLRCLPKGGTFLAPAFFAVGAVGSAFLLWSGVSPGTVPDTVRLLMVGRWLNLDSVAFPAVTFAVLGHLSLVRRNPFALAALLLDGLLILTLRVDAFTAGSHLWTAPGASSAAAEAARGLLFPILGGGAAVLCLCTHGLAERRGFLLPEGKGRGLATAAVLSLVLLFAVLRLAPSFDRERSSGRDGLDPVMEELRRGRGTILTGVPWAVRLPLRTGRSVLVDPEQVDLVAYAPDAAPEMERIFNRVYGVSLLRKRSEGEAPTALAEHLLPRGWPERTLPEWRRVRAEYGVTAVIVPAVVPLSLPLAASVPGGLAAYLVPAAGERPPR